MTPTDPRRPWGFDTAQIHAGARPDPSTGARATPIYATSSFQFESAEQAADLFALNDLEHHTYTRLSNPTTAVAEERIAFLEGGASAVAVSSGQAANTLALLNLLRSGDHLVSSSHIYGGSSNLFARRFSELGISTTFIDDIDDFASWRRAIQPNTRAVFAESVGNPLGSVLDIATVAGIAHAAGVPLVIDNTLATPYLLQPLRHGADIVTHSTTKFLSGHGTAIGGIIVDGATFDFGAEPDKWPGFTFPDLPHEAQGYWARFSPQKLAYALRLRTTVLRDYGPAPSPFNSFLLLQGLETLSLRVRQHVTNAQRVADFLHAHPQVAAVHYATHPHSRWARRAAELLPRGAGAIVSFEIRGGGAAGQLFAESLRLFSHLANIGDVRSLVIHPASTTHAQLSPDVQRRGGITPGLIRLSVGLEDPEDLIADLEFAFAAVQHLPLTQTA
ncbi:O-acetylhomoserine aminocarboxypropyltransferase/cysteine synthase family protein [Deinococcus hopiensis]|uniref:O-acetylhomoserine (Thiol)-lyase n=1 Tax=Deinococcus hopiensis KR-140 TaxID=695939 RepID=A0A1W1UVY9_9DEIO|nr:aminotransferase class I/II-fold pyridoxal phosphate-dependent enzyme [Deinococcus hopiensis]SMB85267.1 O-acetylhomoserine (thiol)-lyase [Deinococcus hopiensis KR-140]